MRQCLVLYYECHGAVLLLHDTGPADLRLRSNGFTVVFESFTVSPDQLVLSTLHPRSCCKVRSTMSGQMISFHRSMQRLASISSRATYRQAPISPSKSCTTRSRPSICRYPLSSQCLQARSFTSSSPRFRTGDKLYHRTGVRIFVRGTSLPALTHGCMRSHSHSDQRPFLSVSAQA